MTTHLRCPSIEAGYAGHQHSPVDLAPRHRGGWPDLDSFAGGSRPSPGLLLRGSARGSPATAAGRRRCLPQLDWAHLQLVRHPNERRDRHVLLAPLHPLVVSRSQAQGPGDVLLRAPRGLAHLRDATPDLSDRLVGIGAPHPAQGRRVAATRPRWYMSYLGVELPMRDATPDEYLTCEASRLTRRIGDLAWKCRALRPPDAGATESGGVWP